MGLLRQEPATMLRGGPGRTGRHVCVSGPQSSRPLLTPEPQTDMAMEVPSNDSRPDVKGQGQASLLCSLHIPGHRHRRHDDHCCF